MPGGDYASECYSLRALLFEPLDQLLRRRPFSRSIHESEGISIRLGECDQLIPCVEWKSL
jgi:hypothetical protein